MDLADYRQYLVEVNSDTQSLYDHTILIGSGLGLVLMTVFPAHSSRVAFIAWAIAIAMVLVSLDTSTRAFSAVIKSIDDGIEIDKTFYRLTTAFNYIAYVACVAGLTCFVMAGGQ